MELENIANTGYCLLLTYCLIEHQYTEKTELIKPQTQRNTSVQNRCKLSKSPQYTNSLLFVGSNFTSFSHLQTCQYGGLLGVR